MRAARSPAASGTSTVLPNLGSNYFIFQTDTNFYSDEFE
jgi:hypothetical protein